MILLLVGLLVFIKLTTKSDGTSIAEGTPLESVVAGIQETVFEMTGLDKSPWIPLDPPVTTTRDAATLYAVCKMFNVETAKRYAAGQQGGTETYCNIYIWDVTKALGCEVPHWVDDNGDPAPMGHGKEQDANQCIDWLAARWDEVNSEDARLRAANGFPVVVCYRAPAGRIGHVAMLLPNGNVAQAGRTNLFDAPLTSGFGNLPVRYFTNG